jgi:hypothetical protein
VHEGLAVTQLSGPVSINKIERSTNGVHLHWVSFVSSRFQVEWSPFLNPSSWNAFTNIIAPANGSFDFIDDGSQSGGLQEPRFYRLRQLP